MADEKNSKSLRSGGKRKGKPTISAPRQISGPIRDNDVPIAQAQARSSGASKTVGNESVPLPRARPPPTTGGKTSDLVKRRYSTRFNQIPEGFDVNAPPIPSLPAFDQFSSSFSKNLQPPPSRSGTAATDYKSPSAAPTVDIKALRAPTFNADSYVTQTLSDATEDQIRDFEESLRKVRNRASMDLQANVSQNRTQFIKISKEAEKLKDEMRALKSLMSDLKTNTTVLRSASSRRNDEGDGGLLSLSSKRDRRSSVADRTVLWNTQMQALYKNVEGSQKFLPNASGRHVVQDAGLWIELDNATHKSRRSMQIFLLNDHLLVASRKKRKADGPGAEARGPLVKLVADRCWPLLDVEVLDMAGSGSAAASSDKSRLSDAIMVRGGTHETVIYKTEKSDAAEKSQLLLNIRKVVEELRRGLQSEMEATNKAKETINYFASRDPGLLQKTDLLETLSDIKDMHIEVDGKQQSLRWVESQMDELDIDIALQNLADAVQRVEKMKSLARGLRNNAVAQDFIGFKVDERAARLATLITRDLIDSHNEQRKTKRNVNWLARLGYEDRAREAYLNARTQTIQKRSRQCIFHGDLLQYIWQLSFVYFLIIKNTVSCFQSCFPTPMMSACVKWAKGQVEAFNAILARQLSSTERGSETWEQCISKAKEHAQMLADVGLDFRNLVGQDVDAVVPAANSSAATGHVNGEVVGLGLS